MKISKMEFFVKIVYGFQCLTTSAKELLRLRNIIGKPKINSIRNKLTPFLVFTSKKIDKLLASESKNDDAFSLAQFCSVLLKHCETFTYRNKSFPKKKQMVITEIF